MSPGMNIRLKPDRSDQQIPLHPVLDNTLITWAESIKTLSQDSNRLSSESLRHQNLLQGVQGQMKELENGITDVNTCIDSITQNQEILQQDLLSLKKTVNKEKSSACDGTLIWRIDNVSNIMSDAQHERQTSIYSPPFHSSPPGYKMRARLYAYGDGNARGTHMSVFFVLMRGDNDPIIKWPFDCKVTFCLFDQSGQHRDVIASFRPDTSSNSFQRPRLEMNEQYGIQKFCPLPVILQDPSNYVIDDVMFIKCSIEKSDNIRKFLSGQSSNIEHQTTTVVPYHSPILQYSSLQTQTTSMEMIDQQAVAFLQQGMITDEEEELIYVSNDLFTFRFEDEAPFNCELLHRRDSRFSQ
ncbi:unnamed protein product [Didymodactylos carnosus]|uniref:MATH domain-containing protein n=1 Tax=Didymodactylos carnosus TaxID=1234261 RepID=A0A815PX07_9BILA|nr:unnamed protein product [Didymodactylos carnosus]CAF4327466.1 unnamed protein product [Didymodactylos carnosus]